MYSFDGKHKTRTKVSLGGNSRQVGKKALIDSAREERMKRETTRRQNNAVLTLQAWTRGCLSRLRTKNEFRQYFDSISKNMKEATYFHSMMQSSALIHFFYYTQDDYERLVGLCQVFLKLVSSKQLEQLFLANIDDLEWRIKRILVLCSRTLPSSSQKNISIPLRMLEVFTNHKSYSWMNDEKKINNFLVSINLFLIKKGYFWHLRELLNDRVPNSLEPSTNPPTPLADAIKDLILKPLKLHNEGADTGENYIRSTNVAFIQHILAFPMTEQTCYFLIPAIAHSIHLPSLLHIYITMETECVNVWMLYSFITIFECQADQSMDKDSICNYTKTLNLLVRQLKQLKDKGVLATDGNISEDDAYSSDEDDVVEPMEVETKREEDHPCYKYTTQKCLSSFNGDSLVVPIITFFNQTNTEDISITESKDFLHDLCSICHHLIATLMIPVHKSKFLYTLAFSSTFLRLTWYHILSMTTITNTGKTVQLLHQLSHGNTMTVCDQDRIVPVLSVYTTLLRFALFSIYDSDFYGSTGGCDHKSTLMPFTIPEVIEMSRILRDVILGIILFMYQDKKVFHGPNQKQWHTLCQSVTLLVKQLYARDCRRRFCPDNHWLSPRAALSQESIKISVFLDDETEENSLDLSKDVFKPGMSTLNARNLAILEYVPFAVPFLQRVIIFQRILQEDKKNHRDPDRDMYSNRGVESISINRKYLYQDAYDQLSKDRCQDIKRVVRVQMVNAQGLDEAGIDGGGVFREFMTQLIKDGYDPSYGFFNSTSQQLLYPNPDISLIHPDFLNHFNFLGRMLGKVLYESMMVELPLADFFLCKLLNKHGSDVDIHHLESLDPELFKNLFDLKNYSGDADDLSLNFTLIKNQYGEAEVIELKPGGKDICVNNSNKIEYIHLMADYKLNKQLRNQCNAFRAGLSDVIDLRWLQMFSHHELQILISGAHVAIDIDDLKKNTNYSGAFSEDDPYIQEFWTIIESLTDKQKQQFLKFVTSCSRPPLLGFAELYPKFCIHSGGEEDRLPTASTCMNFLKLPKYNNKELLRKRLVYAIEAEAGFELS